MDPLRIHHYKIQAINKHKRQLFVNNILLYSLTTLTCTLFCSSPLWYPLLCTTFNAFLSLPREICSLFFTTKVLFIVGNLIVIFLVGESKMFASDYTSHGRYDEYKCESTTPVPRNFSSLEENQAREIGNKTSCQHSEEKGSWRGKITREVEDLDEDEGLSLPAEELNKLTDDFIARVNRQRRLEAVLVRG